MNTLTLKTIAQAKGLTQSDIARFANVSRQCVSQWFNGDDHEANVGSRHLKALADALGVTADELLRPLPLVADQARLEAERTLLLWDRLYPDVPALAAAAVRGEPAAVARLVQVYGLYAVAKMLGARVWRQFPVYKAHILPARRRALETLWSVRQARS